MNPMRRTASFALAICLAGCASPSVPDAPASGSVAQAPTQPASPSSALSTTRIEHRGYAPVVTGEPIALADLSGRIVFDDFEDVFAMDVDGSNVVRIAGEPGAEFDGDWSPDGAWVAYRDSTRGLNDNDEIAIARADGSDQRLLTDDPANDWGPEWAPDGSAIAFNSDRDGGQLRGYLMDPDGSNVRVLSIEGWVEYPSFSPDGTRIAYMGHDGGDYEIYVAVVATGAAQQLTDSPGDDSWPAWSPDGSTIAFSSERDDCRFRAPDEECWIAGPDDEHRDIWVMAPDGSGQRKVNGELAQFVGWSPDSRYLLVSGRALYVVRPDGTGRLELRADGIDQALGGIPGWHAD